jgi:hypothetical protein
LTYYIKLILFFILNQFLLYLIHMLIRFLYKPVYLSSALGSAALGSAALGSAALGSAALGSAALGSAALGSAALGPAHHATVSRPSLLLGRGRWLLLEVPSRW